MKHEEIKQILHLYLYDELDAVNKNKVKVHLNDCKECTAEFEKMKKLFENIAKDKSDDVDEILLNQARYELRGYLRARKQNRSFINDILSGLNSFITKPAGFAFSSIIILITGVAIGFMLFHNSSIQPANDDFANNSFMHISNINFIDSDPSDGQIEFTYNLVKNEKFKGSISDPSLQQLLTYAVLNEKNPGTRLNSINVLNTLGSVPHDNEVKKSLIKVAMYDENPGVRREALVAIKSIPADADIKDALVYILLNDSSSAMRIEAINSLTDVLKNGYNISEKDLTVLKQKVETEQNNYVKFQVSNLLKEY